MNRLKQSALSDPYLHRASVDSIRLRYEATILPNTIPEMEVRRKEQSHLLWRDLEGKGVYGTCAVALHEFDGCKVRYELRRFKRGEPLSFPFRHGNMGTMPRPCPRRRCVICLFGLRKKRE